MTRRFLALLQIAVIFAAAGIPVALAWALWDAWRLLPSLGEGISYWSLAAGFAIGSFGLFVSLFTLVGLVFGLMLVIAPPERVARRPVQTATWLGIAAGLVAGCVAYRFGGWGAGESLASWWIGALTLGAICAITCGSLAALYFRLAASSGEIGSSRNTALPPG